MSATDENSSGFDPILVHHYVADHKYRDIVEELIACTQYYTKKQVLDFVERQIDKWLAERDNSKKLFILLPQYKIGSQHWLYKEFKHKLPEHEVRRNYEDSNAEDFDNQEVCLIDDWCLTGTHICGILGRYIVSPEGLESDILYPKLRTTVTFIFAITGIEYKTLIFEEFQDMPGIVIRIYTELEIKHFNTLCTGDRARLVKFNNYTRPGVSNPGAYPIHLEYKIANEYGSYPSVYDELRDPPDRKFMEEVIQYFS